MKICSPYLMGGIGNMMFQIAVSRAYCLRYKFKNIFYSNFYQKSDHPDVSTYKSNILKNIQIIDHYAQLPIFSENSFRYSEIPKIEENFCLYGYFQSEKYFEDFYKEISDLFYTDYVIKDDNFNTCSIHVRRGDYLNLTNCYHILDLDYYTKAMSFFDKNTVFKIFSNDIEWCKVNFTEEKTGYKYFIFESCNTDYIDFALMSKCNDNIIGNSSFSWWAAWLNKNKNKRIIAPSKWFTDEYSLNICKGNNSNYLDDLLPNNWIRI